MSKPIVAVVGRPNVGKSTLFNKLCGQRLAIVEDTPGITRDRIFANCEWSGHEFLLVDTGGIEPKATEGILAHMREQAQIAIDTADCIIMVVDVRNGLTAADEDVAHMLRRSHKPIILAVNKCDKVGEAPMELYEFYNLGFDEVMPISSVHGHGTGDLLDEVLRLLPEEKAGQDDDRPDLPHITIVGKPNVGKSSLTNALLGEERNIVTPVAGTTRDSISTLYNKFGHEFMLVDTAGMRRKAKVNEDLEFYSVMRSIRAIEHSDVCILMIDANSGMEAQDMSIFNLIVRNRKACVLVVNKWDLFIKDSNTMKEYEKALRRRIAPFDDVPIIFTSVTRKQRIMDVLDEAEHVYENYSRKLSTARLNEAMLPEIENYPPPAWKGKYVKIKYVTQLPTRFPAFAFFCNLPQYVKEPYKRFLENKLREHFDLHGCPVQVFMRAK